jgi:hypothetical protein
MEAKAAVQNPRFVVDQLAQQFEATFEMFESAVKKAPDELWESLDPKPPFWHEAYHTLFWCDNFVGGPDKPFERCPVGVDIDPRLFSNPEPALSRQALLELLTKARGHVAQRLGAMTDADLEQADKFAEESPQVEVRHFDVVLHRILYCLRHGQHHVGKLAGRLRTSGTRPDGWRG